MYTVKMKVNNQKWEFLGPNETKIVNTNIKEFHRAIKVFGIKPGKYELELQYKKKCIIKADIIVKKSPLTS